MPYTTEYDLVKFDPRTAVIYLRVRVLDGATVIETNEDVPVRLPVDASGNVPVGTELTAIIASQVAKSFSTIGLAETERLARITDAGGVVTNADTIYAITEETEPESIRPLLGYGITSFLATAESYNDLGMGTLNAVHTLPSDLATADYIAASVSWQYSDAPFVGGNVELTTGQYTIVGTTFTILPTAGELGIDTGRPYTTAVNIAGDQEFTLGETYTITDPARLIQVNGPGSFREHLTDEPAPGSGGTRAVFTFGYDGSGYINSITLDSSGLGYNYSPPSSHTMLFYTQYNPADVLAISSTIDFEYQDENSIYGRVGGLNVIGEFYDWRNNTDPAAGGNGGPYGWGAADDTPITATWTDGSRTISLTYQRTLASITPSPPPYTSNLNYWYSFIVLDPVADFTVTGDWTSTDFLDNNYYSPAEKLPQITFEIDYDDPTTITLLTDMNQLNSQKISNADKHHLQINLYYDGMGFVVDPSETLRFVSGEIRG